MCAMERDLHWTFVSHGADPSFRCYMFNRHPNGTILYYPFRIVYLITLWKCIKILKTKDILIRPKLSGGCNFLICQCTTILLFKAGFWTGSIIRERSCGWTWRMSSPPSRWLSFFGSDPATILPSQLGLHYQKHDGLCLQSTTPFYSSSCLSPFMPLHLYATMGKRPRPHFW